MTPNSLYTQGMVQILFNAAARATAENVVLSIEDANLRKKETTAADFLKTRSRKELSKARWITSEDVTGIQGEQEERDRLAEEKKLWAIEKKAAKVVQDEEQVQGPSKKTRHTKKKVVINPLPEVIVTDVAGRTGRGTRQTCERGQEENWNKARLDWDWTRRYFISRNTRHDRKRSLKGRNVVTTIVVTELIECQ